jgi:hypothetical protein
MTLSSKEPISRDITQENAEMADLGSRAIFNKPLIEVITDLESVGSTLSKKDFDALVEAGILVVAEERATLLLRGT